MKSIIRKPNLTKIDEVCNEFSDKSLDCKFLEAQDPYEVDRGAIVEDLSWKSSLQCGDDLSNTRSNRTCRIRFSPSCETLPEIRPPTPKIVVCSDCKGYSYAGQTCGDQQTKRKRKAIPDSVYPCCPCCKSSLEIKLEKKMPRSNNPIMSGPFSKTLKAIFSPGVKGNKPSILGFRKDGSPIYGLSETESEMAMNDEKKVLAGWKTDGTPVHLPPHTNPKQALAVLGVYIKDGKTIYGTNQLNTGMELKGFDDDGLPKYASTSDTKSVPKPKKNSSIVPPKQTKLKLTGSKIKRDVANFYPIHKLSCSKSVKRVPAEKGWRWHSGKDDNASKLPLWYPTNYSPGAVPVKLAKTIRKNRRKMKVPAYNWPKCPCDDDCKCRSCSVQKKINKKIIKLGGSPI